MRPTWPPAAAPQIAAGAEAASAVCGRLVLTEQEITMSPRNVIYYNSGNAQISLGGIAQLPYTDVIVAKQHPDATKRRQECADLIWREHEPADYAKHSSLPKLRRKCE